MPTRPGAAKWSKGISAQMDDLGDGEKTRKEERIRDYLRLYWGVEEERLDRLYHPSMIEAYPQAKPDANGILRLGSPRTAAVRNPMAMRALFRLRALINELLREGKIDRGTRINIEFSRKLNDANMRKAIERYQRERYNPPFQNYNDFFGIFQGFPLKNDKNRR